MSQEKNLPPQDLNAERSVLGSVLLDPEVLPTISEVLEASAFYNPRHKIIYSAMISLLNKNRPVDVVTLTSELKSMKKLQESGGGAYLSELVVDVPTAANVKYYTEIVIEKSTRRKLVSLAREVDELSRNEGEEIDDVIDEVQSKVYSISSASTQKDFFTAQELAGLHFAKTEEYSKNPDAMRGIPSGINAVDGILGGFHKSDLIILAARPAVGKSSFAYGIARHIAVEEEKTVAVFSLEMPAIQIFERLLSQQIHVGLWELRTGKLSDDAYQRSAEGYDKLSNSNLFIDETASLSAMQIRSKARKLKMERGLDFIIVDYLQLMSGGGSRKSDSRAQEVSEMSRALKLLARELDIPVMALSQLNRAVENRSDRIPQLSDLRESGSIEQDADVVLFLNREKLYNADIENPEESDFVVAKHRNGATGRTKIRFIEELTKFADLEY